MDNIGILVACVVLAVSDENSSDPVTAYVTTRATVADGISSIEKELMSFAVLRIRDISGSPSMRINLQGLIQRIEMAQKFLF